MAAGSSMPNAVKLERGSLTGGGGGLWKPLLPWADKHMFICIYIYIYTYTRSPSSALLPFFGGGLPLLK